MAEGRYIRRFGTVCRLVQTEEINKNRSQRERKENIWAKQKDILNAVRDSSDSFVTRALKTSLWLGLSSVYR
jgi:hypothetical protein